MFLQKNFVSSNKMDITKRKRSKDLEHIRQNLNIDTSDDFGNYMPKSISCKQLDQFGKPPFLIGGQLPHKDDAALVKLVIKSPLR